jgi:hypothetical protein
MTSLAKTSILDAVHELENKKIIGVIRDSTRKAVYRLNTDVNQWTTGSLHPTSLGVKNTTKTLPVSSQNPTKTGSLHRTKLVALPKLKKTPYIYI